MSSLPFASALVAEILRLAALLGPDLVRAITDAIRSERPDLLPDPPESQADVIEGEDEDVIARKFG